MNYYVIDRSGEKPRSIAKFSKKKWAEECVESRSGENLVILNEVIWHLHMFGLKINKF